MPTSPSPGPCVDKLPEPKWAPEPTLLAIIIRNVRNPLPNERKHNKSTQIDLKMLVLNYTCDHAWPRGSYRAGKKQLSIFMRAFHSNPWCCPTFHPVFREEKVFICSWNSECGMKWGHVIRVGTQNLLARGLFSIRWLDLSRIETPSHPGFLRTFQQCGHPRNHLVCPVELANRCQKVLWESLTS